MQNRELQIMRLVSHPNVVDLKAFFYSNGDKVRFRVTDLITQGELTGTVIEHCRKMKCTST